MTVPPVESPIKAIIKEKIGFVNYGVDSD